jgi:hypothetical protein
MRPHTLTIPVVFAALLGCMAQPGGAAAANAPNPNPALIARWEPCEPNTGVTVIVDEQKLAEGNIYVGCALGEQANGAEALEHAGFHIEGTKEYGLDFVCRIEGEPTPAEQTCQLAAPADAYWTYWHGEPGGRWGYSDSGALGYKPNPGSVEGWSFGGGDTPRIEPMDGNGPSTFRLPPAQESSVIPAVLTREWLTGATLATVRAIEENPATENKREVFLRLLSQAQALTQAGVSPSTFKPLTALLEAGCEEHNVVIEGCGLREVYDPGEDRVQQVAAAVLGLQALGKDPKNFAGHDPRKTLEDMVESDGKVQQDAGGEPTEELPSLAQTVLALARSGTLSTNALATVELILAHQEAGGQFGQTETAEQVQAIQALNAASEQGESVLGKDLLQEIEDALPKADVYLESIQEPDGGVRQGEANEPATHPTVVSTSQGALGLALTGDQPAAQRAAKWVSQYQVTAEYAGIGNTEIGEHTPAEALIGAFLPNEAALKTALAYGEPAPYTESQNATWPALLALVTAGPYGPYDAVFDQESLFFESRVVGSASKPLTATVTNNDVRQVTIAGVGVAGAQAGDFSVVGEDCAGRTLAPGESCEVSASFDPSTTGLREALLQATLTGTTQTIDVPLTGTGATAPIVVPERESPSAQQAPPPQQQPAPPSANGAHASLKKPESKMQKLAKTLKQCRREKSKKRRVSCERQAREKYAPKAERATGKKKAGKSTAKEYRKR